MNETPDESGTTHYETREVIGVLATADALDNAIEQLEMAGVDRAALSVLAVAADRSGRAASLPGSVQAGAAHGPIQGREMAVSQDALAAGEVAAIAVPFQIGGFAGAWAVVAAGGALVAAIGATIAGGAAAAGLGALLYRAVARRHVDEVHAQLANGGFALWVSTPDEAAERRAAEVLNRCRATAVHTHATRREWGVRDSPLHGVQPDPFLGNDAAPSKPANPRPEVSLQAR